MTEDNGNRVLNERVPKIRSAFDLGKTPKDVAIKILGQA